MKVEIKSESEAERLYDEMLDSNNTIIITGINFEASDILKKLDPTAYRVGFSDYPEILKEEGIIVEGHYHEGEDYFKCPECEEAYDDEDEANECCEI